MSALTWLALALITVAAARPAIAQPAYNQGVDDGYNDHFPDAGTPSTSTPYGRGFQDGQDEADDDDARQQRAIDAMNHPPPDRQIETLQPSPAPAPLRQVPDPLTAAAPMPTQQDRTATDADADH